MDYEGFRMSHVREEYQRHGDPHLAVVRGLAGTARVITSAALIMVSVFCAFLLSGDPNIKQFGLGMAIAVAIDATLVRCLLVPAVMVLFRRAAWGMPAWLARLTPHLDRGRGVLRRPRSIGRTRSEVALSAEDVPRES